MTASNYFIGAAIPLVIGSLILGVAYAAEIKIGRWLAQVIRGVAIIFAGLFLHTFIDAIPGAILGCTAIGVIAAYQVFWWRPVLAKG